MDLLTSLLGRGDFLPHGYCFTWTPGLLWSMVGADGLIAAAYFSIPAAILSFMRKRGDPSLTTVAWLFSAFIFACGVTHLMDIWTIWQPDYALQAATKIVTAALSVATALALWSLIPKALKIPSVPRLQAVIGSLETEVRRRRSAEDHLVDLQQNLAVTLASMGAGFIATDRDGKVVRMNAVAEQVTGWKQGEALGQSLWQVFDREDRPVDRLTMNPVEVMLEHGTTIDTAHHVVAISRQGVRATVELKAALTRGEDGAVRGLAMVFRDMTERLRAEVEANQLAAIVESSIDAIIGKTLDGRITSWNAAARNLLGYSTDEVIGQPVQMLMQPGRETEETRILANLARGLHIPAFDAVWRTKTGELIDVSIAMSPIHDANGRIVGASKIVRDVSAQRRAEAALRDSEARLRFTLESAQIGDWELDLATQQGRHSIRHARCFGYDEPQPEWNFETFVQHVHPEDRSTVVQTFHAAIEKGSEWRFDCRVIWPDASVHWVSGNASLQYENGLPRRMLGIVVDVTEQRLAEQARITAQRLEVENRQIQEANRLKSQFLANMSHELRTPLNAIIGFADLLHSGTVKPESPKHQQFLGHISTSGRHLLQLINDVLDLSKVESGKFEFFPEPVHLPLLIKEAGDILLTAMQHKRIEFTAEVDPALEGLVLDPARFKQVLYNYLSNAIKFTPEGGRVSVRALAEGPDHFRLEVEDSGIGIAEADLPRLFSEFRQLDSGYSKRHQGTGLGLSLTSRLVQAQGGSVGVRSVLGTGSVFHLVLARVHSATPVADPAAPAGSPERRLLVIENWDEQTRLVQSLRDAGFQVDAASTGAQAQALAKARTTAYTAITLDLLLPDQRGLSVLASIRAQGPSRDSPVVGVTMPAQHGSAAAFSIADVLSKPIRTDEVVAAMARFQGPARDRAKVMVIDDDPMALDLMRAALAGMGLAAVCMPDGHAALREIDAQRPDAIVLDLMMPGFDGFEVLDALRRLPQHAHVPVFIWTSMILTEEEYASLSRSARAILGKGGGGMSLVLESLRHWNPPAPVPVDRSKT